MNIQDLPNIAILFVIVGVVISVGLAIETDVRDSLGEDDCSGYWNTSSQTCQVSSTNSTTLSSNTEAYNTSGDAIEGTSELSSKLPLIGLVISFSLILGVLGQFMFNRR